MTLEFAFGDAGDASDMSVGMGLPFLGGDPRESVLASAEPAGSSHGLTLWRCDGGLAGVARTKADDGLEAATARIYGAVLRATSGLNLYRIWNVVPDINGLEAGGLENYRAFCKGRWQAFEETYGEGFSSFLPAASAIGAVGGQLTIVFLAGARAARHHENPAQVPAYLYPLEHGPRPPSFARATVVERGGFSDVFISGTSAVMGHGTVAPHDTAGQLECTVDNLGLISRECGLGERFGRGRAITRHFKVYLRNASDLAAVDPEVRRRLVAPGDRVTYLGADICRSALNIEIELTVRGAERS
jgi:hypothetical protein